MLIGYQDYRTAATIVSVTSQEAAYPAEALLRSRLSDGWRAVAGASPVSIVFDLGAAVGPAGLVAFSRVRIGDAGTARLEAAAGTGFSPLLWDSGTVAAISQQGTPLLPAGHQLYGRTVLFQPPAVTARYWRLTLAGLPSSGPLAAGLATFWRTWSAPSPRVWSPALEVDEDTGQTRRRVSLLWPELLADDDRAKLEGLLSRGRGLERLFVVPDGLGAPYWDAVYATVTRGSVRADHVLTHLGARWNVSAELAEVVD